MALHKVTKIIHFCYGHRLLNYAGKCRNLHGHNGVLEIDIEAEQLDELGMVIDFSVLKDVVKTWVDENLDHRMLLCEDDSLIPLLKEAGEPIFVMKANPTAENIAQLIFHAAAEHGLRPTEVRLWETPNGCATYSES